MHIGDKMTKKVAKHLPDVEAKLADDESVLAIFQVNQLAPMLDLLIVTNARMVATQSQDLKSKPGFKVSALGDDLTGVDVAGFGRQVIAFTTGGTQISFGSLIHKDDTRNLQAVARHLMDNPPSAGLIDATRRADARMGFSAAHDEMPFVSKKVKGSQQELLFQLQKQLFDGEAVVAVFPVRPNKNGAHLLVFTNARLLGANRPDVTTSPAYNWRIPGDQILALAASGVLDKVTVQLTTGFSLSLGTLLDRNDRAALDHYTARLIANRPARPLAEAVAASGPTLPGNHTARPARDSTLPSPGVGPADTRSGGINNQLDQLQRVSEMTASGALTESQADEIRRQILKPGG